MVRALTLLAALVVVAGCGGGGTEKAATTARAACTSPKAARALARAKADVAAIRRAAALPTKNTLLGNAAVNRATDRFLNDVFTAPLSNLQRNRLIDHAAAALVGACTQCFQALEANRPIVTIVHERHSGSCRK